MMADDDAPDVEEPEGSGVEPDLLDSDDIDDSFEADESIEALAEDESREDDDDSDDVDTPARPTKAEPDEDEDEDEDDIEADLGEILKDRIAAGDDEDEDEEPPKPAQPANDIAPKRSDEWTCEQCFYIVSTSQFGSSREPRCPQGEDPCPSVARAFS